MTDVSPVLAAARRRSTALVRKDVATLLTLLHPHFRYVNANGHVLTRDQYLDQYVRPDDVEWISQVIHDPQLIEVESIAVLVCLVHDVARFSGHDLNETFRSTLTWIRTEDGWQCLAGHTAQLS